MTHSGGRSVRRAAYAFVTAQVALSLLLVAGGALLARSFWQIVHQDFGYRPDGVLAAPLTFDEATFRVGLDPVFWDRLIETASGMPGVRSAAMQMGGPLQGTSTAGRIALPGQPAEDADADIVLVSQDYFETIGLPVVRGRAITRDDRDGAPAVAVISETAARRYFGTDDPIGRRFTNGEQFDAGSSIEIVGVARDLRYRSPREAYRPIVFLSLFQAPLFTTPDLVVHAAGDPMRLVEPLRAAIDELAPGVSFYDFYTYNDRVIRLVRQDRLLAWLAGAFAGLALLLAAIGLYGVIAYAAELRTREIGIRLALGASPGQVRRLLLRDVTWLMAIGLVIGLAATLGLGRFLASVLYELTPSDPATLLAAAGLLVVVGLTAGLVPALRASRLDPVHALREE